MVPNLLLDQTNVLPTNVHVSSIGYLIIQVSTIYADFCGARNLGSHAMNK